MVSRKMHSSCLPQSSKPHVPRTPIPEIITVRYRLVADRLPNDGARLPQDHSDLARLISSLLVLDRSSSPSVPSLGIGLGSEWAC